MKPTSNAEGNLVSKVLSVPSTSVVADDSLLRQAGIVLAGSALVAVCAHIALPLYFTPVPLTLDLCRSVAGPVAFAAAGSSHARRLPDRRRSGPARFCAQRRRLERTGSSSWPHWRLPALLPSGRSPDFVPFARNGELENKGQIFCSHTQRSGRQPGDSSPRRIMVCDHLPRVIAECSHARRFSVSSRRCAEDCCSSHAGHWLCSPASSSKLAT